MKFSKKSGIGLLGFGEVSLEAAYRYRYYNHYNAQNAHFKVFI